MIFKLSFKCVLVESHTHRQIRESYGVFIYRLVVLVLVITKEKAAAKGVGKQQGYKGRRVLFIHLNKK